MLAELVEKLVTMTRPEIVRPPGEPGHIYSVLKPDGSHDRVRTEPAARDHRPLAIDGIAALCELHKDDEKQCVVWYGMSGVTAVFDDADRRDTAKMKLELSEPYVWLLQHGRASFNHKAIIESLRITFAGCLDAQPAFLSDLRQLKIRKNEAAGSDVQHGRESMGREIEASIAGADKLPDSLVLSVPVFNRPGVSRRYEVECAFIINLENQTFGIRPLPGAIDDAADEALSDIRDELAAGLKQRKLDVPLFRGDP